jgi:hypothetical protein
MTALTEDRNTNRRYAERIVAGDAPVAANTTVWNGSLVCCDATGALRPGADVAGLTFVGVAQLRMVDPSGAAARVKPAARCAVDIFKFATTGANAIRWTSRVARRLQPLRLLGGWNMRPL